MDKSIKSICVITGSYPTQNNPVSTFVDQLVCAWADLGINCVVISPQNLLSERKKFKPRKWYRETENGNIILISSPRYISVSTKRVLGYNTSNTTLRNFRNAIDKEVKKLDIKFDCIYGHFIFSSGLTATYIGEKYNIPSFLANGESSPNLYLQLGARKVNKLLKNTTGIISVSSENKKRLLELGISNEKKIGVFPNAIDNNIFYKGNKKEIRKKLGFSQDDYVIVFVGHFIHRKGSLRVSKALDHLIGVKSIFIGSGPEEPTCDGILHKGRVPHDKIPQMLNAADVFVLPTLNEGCCNAIIEAMACGLPIISSDKPFNNDILWKDNSIRIDPMNVSEIKTSINMLRTNPDLRSKMSTSSLVHADSLKINVRAKNILEFMINKINKLSN